jgi:enoyl-CoA hydratase
MSKEAPMANELLRERRGHVELLTINRPEARNAINRATALALSDALDDCETDDDVWVVILTGSDTKAFSAGMDLKAFATGEFPITEKGFGGLTQRDFPKPLIAAVNGSALAGGFELMISCDMVVAGDHAKFGIPEAQRGLIAGGGGLIRLAKLIPRAVAYEMALTADPIDAQRAYELGLVNRVVPSDQVLDSAFALAERIAQNAPLAVRTSKRVMHDSLEMTEAAAWDLNNESFGFIGKSADALEGAIAFAEKRPPNWQGR